MAVAVAYIAVAKSSGKPEHPVLLLRRSSAAAGVTHEDVESWRKKVWRLLRTAAVLAVGSWLRCAWLRPIKSD